MLPMEKFHSLLNIKEVDDTVSQPKHFKNQNIMPDIFLYPSYIVIISTDLITVQ
jgi:hypothetical protein